MRQIWATTELMPFSEETLAAASAAGATEIVELPYASIPELIEGYTLIPDEIIIPQTITAFQAKGALLSKNLYQKVVTWIATADPFTQLAWNEAPVFGRNDAAVLAIANAVGINSSDLDQLFITAGNINP